MAVAANVTLLRADDQQHQILAAGARHLPRRGRLDVAEPARPELPRLAR